MYSINEDKIKNRVLWIESVIDSCDFSKKEQEIACNNLIENLRKQVVFSKNDTPIFSNFEKKLRIKLFNKFYKIKNKQK